MSQQTKWGQFGTLITVFFFWGFVAASNDILIPVFKKAFSLSQFESQLVSVAFYVAYTVGSIIYFIVSKFIGSDLLNKIGYKNGIAVGLIISAIGTLLFYPAANNASFILMLTGLFVVGLGFSLQQIAANPLAIVMGDQKTGSQRLIMAGGINNFGTTIGPLLVSFAIFGSVAAKSSVASIESKGNPARMLLIFSAMGITSLCIGMLTSGMISAYAFISVGLFCSTLWPCIFTLAVAGLGKNTNQGSSLLIMMIMGGGLISALQGWLADKTGIQFSYIVGVACFAYLAFYAIRAKAILKNQGIDYDALNAEGGH